MEDRSLYSLEGQVLEDHRCAKIKASTVKLG